MTFATESSRPRPADRGSTGTTWTQWAPPLHVALLLAASLVAALACTAFALDEPATPVDTGPADASPAADETSRIFDEIFSQPDFRRLRIEKVKPAAEKEPPSWLVRLMDWIADFFRSIAGGLAGLGVVVQAIAYGILAAICCAIIWLVVRMVNNYRQRYLERVARTLMVEEGEADIPPGDLPADLYVRRADLLAANGQYREAVGQLILGAMSQTERSGLIRFRRGLTHRDYLRAVRGHAVQHQSFRTMVAIYEPICFGRRPAFIEHFRASLEAYHAGFAEVRVLASV